MDGKFKKKILYGAGFYGKEAFHYYGKEQVYAFVDEKKAGTEYLGKPVLHPSRLVALEDKCDIVVCMKDDADAVDYLDRIGRNDYQRFLMKNVCTLNHYPECFICHQPPFLCVDSICGVVENECPPDIELSERISSAYKKQIRQKRMEGDGQWETLNKLKSDVHDALLGDNMKILSEKLADPAKNNLLRGFDCMATTYMPGPYAKAFIEREGIRNCSYVRRLGEAWGVTRLDNPEAYYDDVIPKSKYQNPSMVLEGLEKEFSCHIDFPNPYRGEIGLLVRNKILSFRAIQALHQAFMIYVKLGRKMGRVLEIGAGTGRVPYFLRTLFGFKEYAIIDLPLSGVASAHFLARTLGGDAISLYGEPGRSGSIQILPPESFLKEGLGEFDLIVNFDSITEMDFKTMLAYWERIKESTSSFLSVNHEYNEHTVHEICFNDSSVKIYSRSPYWMRRGYVEEYMTF